MRLTHLEVTDHRNITHAELQRQLPVNGQAFLYCGPGMPGPYGAALFYPSFLNRTGSTR